MRWAAAGTSSANDPELAPAPLWRGRVALSGATGGVASSRPAPCLWDHVNARRPFRAKSEPVPERMPVICVDRHQADRTPNFAFIDAKHRDARYLQAKLLCAWVLSERIGCLCPDHQPGWTGGHEANDPINANAKTMKKKHKTKKSMTKSDDGMAKDGMKKDTK
jgi:hypothetical protein